MIGLLVCLAGLHLSVPSVTANSETDWVYIGKGPRLVSFESNSDEPRHNDIFIPNHTSGFLLLDQDSFSLSVASGFGTTWIQYQNGDLETTETGFLPKTQRRAMDYQSALFESLDKCVDQRISGVVKEILAKRPNEAPSTKEEIYTATGEKRICEFDGSWRALKRVTFLGGEVKVVLPQSAANAPNQRRHLDPREKQR
jgi:hypothetical protein